MSATTAILSPLSFSPFKPQRDYNHADDAEYKRLRDLASNEYLARSRCYDAAHEAHKRGDGAEAKRISEQGKQHGENMDRYNAQAAAFVFRANNADSDADEIDLHGLYVKEAEEYLEQRIAASKARNEAHLEVIVGKGNHSTGGVAKIKPAVERLCQEHGFQYAADDDNSGVIIINFQRPGGYTPMGQMPFQPKHNFAQSNYHYPSPERPNATYRPQVQYNNIYGRQDQPQYGNSYANTASGAYHQEGVYSGHPQQQFQIEQQQQPPDGDQVQMVAKCLKQCCTIM
ncbi:hypothetical protein POJ06DRAFT_238069 [Lipomyces tetrasporus]|uniref:Smr domain-containing protein n=1 Tax=Lipomyces tetrasporus TaxID=54092 RepID=A0AAD7QSE1_9ASCO|nr:uncharacterized protein POJ06DRAFT_238069 [Lipomyces tetrasporus]KAJ8100565.1 hypothetical protein POJ06DRAFT_238069 [Lipomyces tetrasporus]